MALSFSPLALGFTDAASNAAPEAATVSTRPISITFIAEYLTNPDCQTWILFS